jgi:hypothetical protein
MIHSRREHLSEERWVNIKDTEYLRSLLSLLVKISAEYTR